MTKSGKTKVLIMTDWFLPGFNGGGPITSIANLVVAMGACYDFDIVTSNRDFGQKEPYQGLATDQWLDHSPHGRVWYCSPETQGFRHFRKIIRETEYDLLYLNSMFSRRYTIYPLWVSRSIKPDIPVLLAPRGMLHAGALSLKPLKKKLFLKLLKITGAFKQVTFQATDGQEAKDILLTFGNNARVLQAPNLPQTSPPPFSSIEKRPGQLRLIFMSRLTGKKGLHLLLEYLIPQTAAIHLSIVGPDKEPGYWERCEKIIAQLPANVTVQKSPPIPSSQAMSMLQTAHCFAMPTLGENFGHAIFESFCAGRPVLISDQSPWQDLETKGVGFSLPLQEGDRFEAAIRKLAEMDQDEWERWAGSAYDFANRYISESSSLEENKKLFETVLQSG